MTPFGWCGRTSFGANLCCWICDVFFFFEVAFGKIGFPPRENPMLWNLSFIFANFDNFAIFVDRAVFTFIKDCSEGFPNMVLSTKYSEAVNAHYTFQPWVSDSNQCFSCVTLHSSGVDRGKLALGIPSSTKHTKEAPKVCLLVAMLIIFLSTQTSLHGRVFPRRNNFGSNLELEEAEP